MVLAGRRRAALVAAIVLAVGLRARSPRADEPALAFQPNDYHDGHARPRALAFNPRDGLLYVALSTADQVAVVDPAPTPPRLLAKVDACRLPDAVAALPLGGALVGCRFDPGLTRIAGDAAGGFRAARIAAGLPAGARGVAVVALGDGRLLQTIATGISPRAMRLLPKRTWPGQRGALLAVSNFIDHT